MENKSYNQIHQILGFIEQSSHSLTNEPLIDDYKNCLNGFSNLIFCSDNCAKKNKNDYFIIKISSSKIIFPIQNMLLICKECGNIIKPWNDFFIVNNTYIDDPQKNFLYETTFSKYFLQSLICIYIKKFFVYGFNFTLDESSRLTSTWLQIILNELVSEIEENVSFYRVQNELYPIDGNKDLRNKELMRITDISYLKNNRLSKLGVYNLYLSEDIETSRKEARCNKTCYYSAEFRTNKKFKTIDFTRLDELYDFNDLTKKIYTKYEKKYGVSQQVFVIIKSAVECFRSFIIPLLRKPTDDYKTFKPEYVISQFISDISKLTLVESVIYFSTKNIGKKCMCFFPVGKIDEYFEQKETRFHNF